MQCEMGPQKMGSLRGQVLATFRLYAWMYWATDNNSGACGIEKAKRGREALQACTWMVSLPTN
jgi:hypothetical protein